MLLAVVIVVVMAMFFILQMAPDDSTVNNFQKRPEALHFDLQNQDGEFVTEQDFLGKKLLVFFGFTHCPDVCPTTLITLGKAVELIHREGGNTQYQVIFVTVDPERDTARIIKQYLLQFPGTITGITGSPDQMTAFTRTLRVHVKSGQKNGMDNYPVTHSDLVYMFNEEGEYIAHLRAGASVDYFVHRLQKVITKSRS